MAAVRQTEYEIHPQFTARWSSRAFTGEPIPEATLLAFIEAARWAPSAFNAQPWRFVYGVQETPGFEAIFGALNEFNQGWARRASALIAVLSATRWQAPGSSTAADFPSHSLDTGAAWGYLALQAQAAGWNAHGIGGFDRQKLREALAVPAEFHIEAVVAIGRQGEDKSFLPESLQAREQPSPRKPLAEIAAAGRFSF
ncbi:nitroreductase family protein [Pelomonas sp. KK5]|uniref:nitroreductase family protein n=1 Tax=Pelomonas sp. KK5 TaxID=1855730 RepID=UPI00097C21A6|nr:nitroreductase family protein [Pelomonas sp. KK5]